MGSVDVALDADDLRWIDDQIGRASGDRYPDMATVDR